MAENDAFDISHFSQMLETKHFQTAVQWKVFSLKERTKRNVCIFSPIFKCSNTSWRLTLRFSPESTSKVYLILNKLEGNQYPPFAIYFLLLVYDEAGIEVHRFHSKKLISSEAWNAKCLAVYSDMHGKEFILEQNPLTVCFYICVEDHNVPVLPLKTEPKFIKDEKKESLQSGCFLDLLSSSFEELYDNPQLSDVTLKLGGEEFQAHKSVLSARSKMFAAMFQHNMKENQKNTVDLVQMEAKTVQDMLRYMYCGKVRVLSLEEALNLYVAADRYDLQELKTFCREIVLQNVSVSNVCDIAIVADLHNDQLLINVLKSFLLNNGEEIIKTEKWKLVSMSKPVLCTKMFEWIFSK